MAASRPIIASINGSGNRIINKAHCGLTCDAGDEDGFVELLQRVIDNPSIMENMGRNGRRYFLNNLTLNKHVDKLEQHLKEVISLR